MSDSVSTELVEVIREMLAEMLGVAPGEIGLDDDLIDDLHADSLHQLELMTAIEERFGVALDVEDWRSTRTVSEFAERTRLQLAAQPRP